MNAGEWEWENPLSGHIFMMFRSEWERGRQSIIITSCMWLSVKSNLSVLDGIVWVNFFIAQLSKINSFWSAKSIQRKIFKANSDSTSEEFLANVFFWLSFYQRKEIIKNVNCPVKVEWCATLRSESVSAGQEKKENVTNHKIQCWTSLFPLEAIKSHQDSVLLSHSILHTLFRNNDTAVFLSQVLITHENMFQLLTATKTMRKLKTY